MPGDHRGAHQPQAWPLLFWRYADDVAMLTTAPLRVARDWAATAQRDHHWYAYLGYLWPRSRMRVLRPGNAFSSASEPTTAGSDASDSADSD